MNLLDLRKDLKEIGNKDKAELLQGFFKTGKGEYGEGDIFIGITVPDSRKIAIKYKDLSFADVKNLLKSKIHEERLIALLILVHNFSIGAKRQQKTIYNFYLKNTKYINNWDLVDLSSHKIVGAYLFKKPKDILYKLAHSKNLWERRIAVISTFYFIKNNEFSDCLKIAEILISDKHDLIQKAVGWMLREVGKKDKAVEIKFLRKYHKQMGRTALRYAIEKFSEKERQKFLL